MLMFSKRIIKLVLQHQERYIKRFMSLFEGQGHYIIIKVIYKETTISSAQTLIFFTVSRPFTSYINSKWKEAATSRTFGRQVNVQLSCDFFGCIFFLVGYFNTSWSMVHPGLYNDSR